MQSVYLALTINWWSRWQHVPPVRVAVESAFRDYWADLFENAINRRGRSCNVPDTKTDVATLSGLTYVQLQRRFTGVAKASFEELASLARTLGIREQHLMIPERKLIAHAASLLCRGALQID